MFQTSLRHQSSRSYQSSTSHPAGFHTSCYCNQHVGYVCPKHRLVHQQSSHLCSRHRHQLHSQPDSDGEHSPFSSPATSQGLTLSDDESLKGLSYPLQRLLFPQASPYSTSCSYHRTTSCDCTHHTTLPETSSDDDSLLPSPCASQPVTDRLPCAGHETTALHVSGDQSSMDMTHPATHSCHADSDSSNFLQVPLCRKSVTSNPSRVSRRQHRKWRRLVVCFWW